MASPIRGEWKMLRAIRRYLVVDVQLISFTIGNQRQHRSTDILILIRLAPYSLHGPLVVMTLPNAIELKDHRKSKV